MRAPIDTRGILGEAKDKKRLDTGPDDMHRQLGRGIDCPPARMALPPYLTVSRTFPI